MNLTKVMPLLLLAIVIDGLQFFISLSLSLIAAFPGTAGGCAVGSWIAGKAGCAVLGLLGSIPLINGALATVTEPIGVVVGIAVTICLSFTLGSMLVLFLQLCGMLDKKAALWSYIGESLPGLDMLPAWTGLVIYCAYKAGKKKVLSKVVSTVANVSKNLVLPNTAVGRAMRQETADDMEAMGIDYDEVQAGAQEAMAASDAENERSSRQVPMQDIKIPKPYAQTA